jgi:hypothetical protein
MEGISRWASSILGHKNNNSRATIGLQEGHKERMWEREQN